MFQHIVHSLANGKGLFAYIRTCKTQLHTTTKLMVANGYQIHNTVQACQLNHFQACQQAKTSCAVFSCTARITFKKLWNKKSFQTNAFSLLFQLFLLQILPNRSHRGRRSTLVLLLQVRKLHKRMASARAEVMNIT